VRLLVVEDDPRLANLIVRGLREQTYAVDVAGNGPDAIVQVALNSYDAIILDVMLPGGMDGFAIVREIRKRGLRTPVMMLTARDAVADRITGLDSGADDYLNKPFDFGELLARLRALLRRPEVLQPTVLQVGDLAIDVQSRAVTRAGTAISLTAKEYALLEMLVRHAHTVVSRADIVAHVWDENHDPFTNAVEVYINRLRSKIDKAPWPPLLHTRRGAGYMLAETPPA
jgi:two-component system copper resistance phosphate regulon response regulator CusR